MKKFIIAVIALFTFTQDLSATELFGYSIQDGKTILNHRSKVKSVSKPVRVAWRKHDLQMTVTQKYFDPKTKTEVVWDKIVHLWFTSESAANNFSDLLKSKNDFNIFYNFDDNKFNSKASISICPAPMVPVFCRERSDMTIIDWSNLDASATFIHDKNNHQTYALDDYLSEKLSENKTVNRAQRFEIKPYGSGTETVERNQSGISSKM